MPVETRAERRRRAELVRQAASQGSSRSHATTAGPSRTSGRASQGHAGGSQAGRRSGRAPRPSEQPEDSDNNEDDGSDDGDGPRQDPDNFDLKKRTVINESFCNWASGASTPFEFASLSADDADDNPMDKE
jgi:hypothetical protein